MVDQIGTRPPSGFSLLRCASAGKVACFYVAGMAWRGRRKSLKVAVSACTLLAGLAALLLVAGGVFVMRLSHSPIVIEGLGPRIAAGLDEKFGRGYHFALGETAITQRGYGPTLGIDGLSLKGADGQTIFNAPYAEVSVDPFALVIGRVIPKRLEVLDVEIKLSVLANGALTVSAGSNSNGPSLVVPPQPSLLTPAAEPDQIGADGKPKVARAVIIKQAAAAVRLLIDTLTNPDSAIAAIDHVGVERGRLVIDDRTTDETTVFNDLELAFDKPSGGSNFHLSAEGPNGRWKASLKANGAPGTERHLDMAFDNITLDEISLASGVRSLGVDFDMPVSAQLKVVLTPEGAVSQGVGQFQMNSGYFRIDDPNDEPLMIDAADGHFHWDPATRRILVDNARMKAGGSKFVIAGAVTPPVLEGDAFGLNFRLAEPGIYGAERPGETPIKIEKGDLAARLLLKDKHLVVDRLSFTGADFGLALAADVDWRNGPHIRLGASIDPTSVRIAERLWPSFIAPPVRSWLLAHFLGGTIQSATMRADFDEAAVNAMKMDIPPPNDSSSLDLTVTDGSVNFLPGVPPLHDITGTAHITGRTTNFSVSSGVLDTESGHRVTISEGSFRIADDALKPTPAIVAAKVTGPLEGVRDLLSYDALKPYASMPLDASPMHGQVDGRLEVDLKIGTPGSPPIEPLILINATGTNVSIEKLIGKEKLDAATMTVNVDATGLKASGQGRLFGVPATLELARPMGAKTVEASLAFTTDDAARAKLGVSTVSGLSGPIGTKISAVLGSPDKQKALVELDLTKTVLDNILPGLSKSAGTAAKASFSIAAPEDGPMQIDQISLDMGAVQVRGALELGQDQSLISAKFSQVRLSPGDDMKVEVSKPGETLKVTIHGTTIDARPFLKPFSVSPGGGANASTASANAKDAAKDSGVFKNIDIDMKCGLLTGHNKKSISNFDMHFVKQNDLLRQFSMSGHFGRDAVSGSMAPGSPQLVISSEDAGSLLSFIDLYRHMESGGLLATLQLGGNDQLAGGLEIENFTLRDEPAMKRLVAGVSQQAPGLDPMHAPRIDADAVPFQKLQVQFQRSGSRLDLHNGVMYGNEIGLTVDGSLDFPHDKVALTGTFVPAYELNNMFSKIPVFGLFLGGGTNEGLFAINYHITGLASQPTLAINPLSLAPGFLRKIFGSIDPANMNPQQPPMPTER